jgi:hypothetical protein
MTIWNPTQQVNQTDVDASGNDQQNARAIQLANGQVLVVWESNADTGAGSPNGVDVLGRIHDIFGDPVGDEFRLNTLRSVDSEGTPAIAALPNGGFVVSYVDTDSNLLMFENDVIVERFNSLGQQLNGFEALNGASSASAIGGFILPSVAAAANNNAMIVSVEDGTTLVGKIVNPVNGATITAAFDIFASPGGISGRPAVEVTNDGDYLVAFVDADTGGSDDVELRTYDSATGVEIHSAHVDSSFAMANSVKTTVLTNGNIVVTWMADGSGGSRCEHPDLGSPV